ncbi:thioesterase [Streptomyces sp. NPDC127079]|uniref:thioesterase n=1 Tax=Streptomyces sp. NPDC127079 TaxID=3347132 RepID=UPI00365D921B
MPMTTARQTRPHRRLRPWVLPLQPAVGAVREDRALPRPPWSDRLSQEDGALPGRAPTAAADTATAVAIPAARGGFVPMTTVRRPRSFPRAVGGSDGLIEAVLTGRAGGGRSPTSR